MPYLCLQEPNGIPIKQSDLEEQAWALVHLLSSNPVTGRISALGHWLMSWESTIVGKLSRLRSSIAKLSGYVQGHHKDG
jgi:hypothetical protein